MSQAYTTTLLNIKMLRLQLLANGFVSLQKSLNQ